MGALKSLSSLVLLFFFLSAGAVFLMNSDFLAEVMRPNKPTIRRQWWGPPGSTQKDDLTIHKFQINVPDKDLEDLKSRLESTRFLQPLEDSNFRNGFNADYLRKVVTHWRTQYKWRVWEKKLNAMPQFTAQIEGLKIHFFHVKAKPKDGRKPQTLLLLHGWPGSVVEFHKVIPLLSTAGFDVIAPSLPGYGWSDAPSRPGLDALETARLMHLLMNRLGLDKDQFYVQGGDWGALIASNMAKIKPNVVRGVHLNMLVEPFHDPRYWLRLILGTISPSFVLKPDEEWKVYPYGRRIMKILDFSGYYHIQATRPDTVAASLNDSPAGLAAYILEKFAGWTVLDHKNLPDGGLHSHFNLDELLTNVMVYWTTGTIGSSVRYYKHNTESMAGNDGSLWQRQPIEVPVGAAASPNEIAVCPESWFRFSHPLLLQYTDMPRGGHFLALEEPQLFVHDVSLFVNKAEGWWRGKDHHADVSDDSESTGDAKPGRKAGSKPETAQKKEPVTAKKVEPTKTTPPQAKAKATQATPTKPPPTKATPTKPSPSKPTQATPSKPTQATPKPAQGQKVTQKQQDKPKQAKQKTDL